MSKKIECRWCAVSAGYCTCVVTDRKLDKCDSFVKAKKPRLNPVPYNDLPTKFYIRDMNEGNR